MRQTISNREDTKLNKKEASQMAKVPNKIIEQAEEEATISDDYKQRLTQIIEEEGDRIRKETEQESAHIITRAREGYRQRLSRFLEKEAEKIRRQAEQDAADIIAKALEEKEHIFAEAKIEAQLQVEQVIGEVKRLAEQEAAKIIDNANDQAMQITAEAKERTKKQAEEEKQQEAERIIEYAKQESAEIIAEARQATEKEVNKIIADAVKEAEERSIKIITLAKQKAAQISGKAMGTRKNGGGEDELAKLIADARRKSEWAAELIAEAKQKAQHTINEAKENPTASEDAADKDNKVDFISDLVNQRSASPSESVRSIWDAAISNAEQILGSAKPSPEVETKEEEDRILTPDNREAEELRKGADTAVGDQLEEVEETVPTAEEQTIEKQMEVEEETAVITPDEPPQLEEEDVTEGTPEAAPTEKDRPAEAEVAEARETPVETKDPEIQEGEPAMFRRDTESLYTGEVEVELGSSVDSDILTKLYIYLVNTPEIKLVHTVGSSNKGITMTLVLDKPIPLVEVLSSKIPEAEVTAKRPGANGKKREVSIINIAARQN